jgi:hypothetical protein
MTTLDDMQRRAFRVVAEDIEFNPNHAIARKWLQLKSDGMLIGVPTGPETELDGGERAQVFTSGAVLVWRGGDDVVLV